MHKFIAVIAAAVVAASTAAKASEASEEAFYHGRVISLYLGFGPGGSYDLFAHLIARHIGKYIPGNPTVVVQSMPGSGSFTAANFMYFSAPRDGSALGMITQTAAIEEVLGTSGVRYKAAQFSWIGRGTSIKQVTLTSERSPVKTIDDAKTHAIPVASTGAGSPSEGYVKLLNGVAGTRFKLVGPYPGSNDGMLAMERGEVDGALTSWSTIKANHADWLAQKKINILVQYTSERAPDLQNVPAVTELGRTEDDKKMLEFYSSAEEIGRSIFTSPGVPAERVATLRRAFDMMTKDPDMLADVAQARSEYFPASGETVQNVIARAAQAPPEIVTKMKAILGGQ